MISIIFNPANCGVLVRKILFCFSNSDKETPKYKLPIAGVE